MEGSTQLLHIQEVPVSNLDPETVIPIHSTRNICEVIPQNKRCPLHTMIQNMFRCQLRKAFEKDMLNKLLKRTTTITVPFPLSLDQSTVTTRFTKRNKSKHAEGNKVTATHTRTSLKVFTVSECLYLTS